MNWCLRIGRLILSIYYFVRNFSRKRFQILSIVSSRFLSCFIYIKFTAVDRFYNASLSENQIQLVAEILSGSDCVKSLAIDFNDTVLEDSTVYAELLHHENQLESLSLRSNGIDAKGFPILILKKLKSFLMVRWCGHREKVDEAQKYYKY